MDGGRAGEISRRMAEARRSHRLDLSDLGLTEVPEEVGELASVSTTRTGLTGIVLARNRLTELPDWIARFTGLKTLDLTWNELPDLPIWLERLRRLTQLKLAHNRIRDLPPQLRGPDSLEVLALHHNELEHLPGWLGELSGLRQLTLNDNRLTRLPENIGDLRRLRLLDLGGNQLAELPASFGRLTSLSYLDLAGNQLHELPPSFGALTALGTLHLTGNPLSLLPPEVVAAGTSALVTFLRERTGAPAEQWSSKIVVVGEGRSGKTSLLKAVRGEPFDAHEDSTHGLRVDGVDLRHPDRPDITMRLTAWDFGGQEIYHATHQFFLTDRALFVLVWDAQIGWEASKLYYWLDMIKARAPRSPVVLVATHIGPRPADLPLADLRAQYPGMIVESLSADCATGEGIEYVRQSLTLHCSRLPLMGVAWPSSWLRASEAVRAVPRTHVHPDELIAVMSENGVSDPGHQLSLMSALHSLGDILAYPGDAELGDMVVLRPQWVTDYISRVLDSHAVRTAGALFTKAHQTQLWSELTPDLRRHFVAMMERFDLSYRTAEGTTSLVVELLPWDPPAYRALWEAADGTGRELRLRYRLHTVPPGIPTWFIAREHRFTSGLHWRSGALLRHPDGAHVALITVDRQARSVELSVRGPYPQEFFAVLKDGFEQTLSRYPGLEIQRLVPCPTTLPDGRECPHEFPHERLKARLTRDSPLLKVECPEDFAIHDVPLLLQGIETAPATQSEELAEQTHSSVRALQRLLEAQTGEEGARHSELLEQLRHVRTQQASVAAEQQRTALAAWRARRSALEVVCPNVVSITREDRRRRLGVGRESFLSLRLYCEQPGAWHPAPEHEPYTVRHTAELTRAVMPYARTVLQVLKYALPVAGAGLGMISEDLDKLLKKDIDLMKALVDSVPPQGDTPELQERGAGRIQWEAEFRVMRSLLVQLDPYQRWGGLNKVLTPEGYVLWLCREHARPFRSARSEPLPQSR